MKVSVVVPTIDSRLEMLQQCIDMFIAQDYPDKEMIIVGLYGGLNGVPRNVRLIMQPPIFRTIGAKRNYGNAKASGQIIGHWDDDDMRKPDWISQSVDSLLNNEADIVGLSKLYFYDLDNGAWYLYTYEEKETPWVAGGTMAYRKSFWEAHPFKDKNIGEDFDFIVDSRARVYAHGGIDSFVATIHKGSTSKRFLEGRRYRRCSEEEEVVLRMQWDREINFGSR